MVADGVIEKLIVVEAVMDNVADNVRVGVAEALTDDVAEELIVVETVADDVADELEVDVTETLTDDVTEELCVGVTDNVGVEVVEIVID